VSCHRRGGQIAKALGRPPESIAARWGAVALKVNQLHHVGSGVEWKTLANHKSNAKAALHWYRNDNELPLRGAPLTEDWRQLRRRIKIPARQTVRADPLLQHESDRTGGGNRRDR